MRCIVINVNLVIVVLLTLILRSYHSQTVCDEQEHGRVKRSVNRADDCSAKIDCSKLPAFCFECDFGNCTYGEKLTVSCRRRKDVKCTSANNTITREVVCQYCWQTEEWEHRCSYKASCKSAKSPREYYVTNCTVNSNVLCLGRRSFNKKVVCNWTGGYSWTTALALSITLGGFGADRFYLGHWQEGIGKLFSFGGIGVWTLIDVILISLHYLGPNDGSLYI